MKKLLSILVSATLVVSAPLTVISCKDDEASNSYDYDQVLNSFIAEVTNVFQSQITKAFKPYLIMDENQLEKETGYTIKTLINGKDDLNRPQSKFFKDTAEMIMKIIPVQDINEELQRTVASNPNYNPVLVDKSTPLKNGIKVSRISLVEKGANITVIITITTDIVYKERNKEKATRPVSTLQQVNIFGKEDVAQTAKAIEQKYYDLLNVKYANQFYYESDSGNLDINSLAIRNSTDIKNDLKTKLLELSGQTSAIIDSNELNLEVNANTFIEASRFASSSPINEVDDSEGRRALMAALRNEKTDSVKNFLSGITGNNNKWIVNEIIDDEYSKQMNLAIEKDPTISEAINQYNLQANFEKNSFLKTVLKVQSSEFKIDMVADTTTIALMGLKLKGVQYKLDGAAFDFPDQVIVFRQKTSFSNTLALYNEFMTSAFKFQSKIVGLENTKLVDNPFETFSIEWPKHWDKSGSSETQFFLEGDRADNILEANEDANKINQKLKMTSLFKSNQTKKTETYMYVNDRGYLITYDGPGHRTNESALRTYFYSSSKKEWNTVSFTFNKRSSRDSFSVPDIPGSKWKEFFSDKKSAWKFKGF
ncbi:hypothetical protein [Spiroplasma endosymbiont of Panorpa germanica]|uniref:hypothetical protein n=1 Tax=Spiroplasma endosymbiont of Panorpa germanica TaxID=3066314 RepID=UPI0030CB393F